MKFATVNPVGLPTTFYSPDIHDETIPGDALPLTEVQWQECIDNDGRRKLVVAADGSVTVELYMPPPEPIADLAARKRREMVTARDQAFADGLPYDIAGTPDVVQTRPQDQINLLGLSSKAQRLIAASDTTTLMPFRGLSNETHMLTAEQMDTLALDALAHIEGIYQRSWDRKDAIDAALGAEDREGIEAVVW